MIGEVRVEVEINEEMKMGGSRRRLNDVGGV